VVLLMAIFAFPFTSIFQVPSGTILGRSSSGTGFVQALNGPTVISLIGAASSADLLNKVDKAGDTMTGDLDMTGASNIVLSGSGNITKTSASALRISSAPSQHINLNNATTSNVGIGTDSPAAKLEVRRDFRVANESVPSNRYFDVTFGLSEATLKYTNTFGGTVQFNIENNTAGSSASINLVTNSTSRLTATSGDGYVGINNVAPSEFLDVGGNIITTGDLILTEQSDHNSTPAAGLGYLWVKDTAPSTLIFTDDDGTDVTLGASVNITTYTSGIHSVDVSDYMIVADATSGAITLNLPAVSSNTGKVYNIKKIDSSLNTVTIDGNSSETIDDSTTIVLNSQYDSVTIVCDGTEWWII